MTPAHAATASDVGAILDTIETEYGIVVGHIAPVVLGVNRTFEVRTSEETYFFRLCRATGRALAEVQAEAAVIAGVREHESLGVARAIPTLRGTYVVDVRKLADSPRYGLLFQRAQGREATTSDADLHRIGRALAQLHAQGQLARLAPRRVVGAPAGDHRWLGRLGEQAGALRQTIERIGARLRQLRRSAVPAGPRGFCHGDFRCGNLRIANDRVILFDFDDCGVGPQWYDLATMGWWLETSLQPQRSAAAWSVFVQAYFNKADTAPTLAPSITLLVAEAEARAARFLLDHCELAPELWPEVIRGVDAVCERACAGQLHILASDRARLARNGR
jgi:Ser/Thr protein kinase RdoA (MazF antagonist)